MRMKQKKHFNFKSYDADGKFKRTIKKFLRSECGPREVGCLFLL